MDKEWAKDLSPVDFETNFMRRFPNADYIPEQNDFLNQPPPPDSMLINPVHPDDYEMNDLPIKKPVPVKEYWCTYCGKSFDEDEKYKTVQQRNMAKIGHERHCKKRLTIATGGIE